MITILLLACAASNVQIGGDGGSRQDPREGADSGTSLWGDTSVEQVDSGDPDPEPTNDDDRYPKHCDEIYDNDLQEFDLDFAAAEWGAMQNDCNAYAKTYRPVTLSWNGESVAAKVRLKGNWSWNCSKLQFVVSFNEDDPDGRWHGLRKLVFDAPWYDRTLLHERMAFPLFERLGLPYSCANNARVNVNGEYYGLYANLERIDHEYVERHFEDASGNLYEAASELKTNQDEPDTSDLDALWAAGTVEQIAAVVDLDEALAEWAAEAMIPALDNYWAGVDINYYVYDYPGRGFLWLPYDLDLAFGDSAYSDGTPVWSNVDTADPITWEHTGWRKEVLFQTVLADEAMCERYVEKLVLARAAYDVPAMQADLDAWSAQIAEAWREDPRAHASNSDHDRSVAQLRGFLEDRAAYVDDWLANGGHCPARW